jgi:hypothetical protein
MPFYLLMNEPLAHGLCRIAQEQILIVLGDSGDDAVSESPGIGGEEKPRQAHLVPILQLVLEKPRQAHLVPILQLVLVFAMMPGASLGERIMPVGFLFIISLSHIGTDRSAFEIYGTHSHDLRHGSKTAPMSFSGRIS